MGGEVITAGDQYFAYNGHGDTTNLLSKDKDSINVAFNANYAYDAFGNLTENTGGESDDNPFRYNGQYTDDETGLIYLRNRYYDPSIGRFTQEDTYWNVNNMIYGDKQYDEDDTKIPDYSAIAQSINLYVYCINDPVNGVDPWGLLSYILYTKNEGSDFSTQANWQAEYLRSNGEYDVVMMTVNNVDDFVASWNSIENGADKVIIYSHGNDRALILAEGSSSNAMTIDGLNSQGESVGNLGYLESKNINELQILSCNSGNMDAYMAGVGNVATVFSWLITGTVYAYDGNVAFGSSPPTGGLFGYSSRLSNNQEGFRDITASYHSGRRYFRNPQGKVAYMNQKLVWYPGTTIYGY